MRVETGEFVSVVGSVDLDTGEASIDYVNPTKRRIVPDADAAAGPLRPGGRVELIVEGDDGTVIASVPVLVREPSSPDARGRRIALVQEELPRLPGMRTLRLRVGGTDRASFTAKPEPAQAADPVPVNLMGPVPTSRNRLGLATPHPTAPERGVTYTVQVKPDDASVWTPLAVGRPTPEFELDRNQVPAARHAKVRILRTTGFEEHVVSELDVRLDFE